jgi:hypothetical protein
LNADPEEWDGLGRPAVLKLLLIKRRADAHLQTCFNEFNIFIYAGKCLDLD